MVLSTYGCKFIVLLYFLSFKNFRYGNDDLLITPETALKLAALPRWDPNTTLCLTNISEVINIQDFCNFVKKKGAYKIQVSFANGVSEIYQHNFCIK